MVNYNPVNPMRHKRAKPVILPHGVNNMSPASQHAHRLALGGGTARARTTHRIKAHTTKRGIKVRGHRAKQRKVKSTGAVAQHFKKGTLAAKRHMSKLRKMRKGG